MKIRRLCQLAALAQEEQQWAAETQIMAAAITATEMQFRPLLHRFIEYIYVAFLLLLGRDAGAISIGISQISIRHYISLEGVTQFQSLLLSLSAKKSLATCCKIIEAGNNKSLDEVCRAYNGNSTWFYRNALGKNYAVLCRLEARRANQKLQR